MQIDQLRNGAAKRSIYAKYVGDLPPSSIQRWFTRHKMAVVAAVHNRTLPLEKACELYNLTEEEFRLWEEVATSIATKDIHGPRVDSTDD